MAKQYFPKNNHYRFWRLQLFRKGWEFQERKVIIDSPEDMWIAELSLQVD